MSGSLNIQRDQNERGATMVENVVVLPLFLVILIISFDMLLMSVHVLTIRYTSARIMREASIGGMTANEIRDTTLEFARSLGTPLDEDDISMCPLADYPCQRGEIDPGDTTELMVLELRAPIRGIVLSTAAKFALTRRILDFRARTMGRREP